MSPSTLANSCARRSRCGEDRRSRGSSTRFAQPEIARLEELRLDALEAWADAGLALGEHAQLIAELESLVREHPLRERYCAQLMVALTAPAGKPTPCPHTEQLAKSRGGSASNPGRSCAGSSGRSSVRIRGSTRPSPPRPAPGLPSVQRACPSLVRRRPSGAARRSERTGVRSGAARRGGADGEVAAGAS